MNWGSLLLWGWDDLKIAFSNGIGGIVYTIGNLIFTFLYFIWKVLAGIVGSIEKIFRSLAGLDAEPGQDLVSVVINNDAVQIIFGNLVGFATALIVFFTIIKILQDHYKEKDGGNPYKVVISTFKGMLMFFFVGIAVTVGLQAAGAVFRGFDAATSGGSSSFAGTVFKAMAAEANRQKRGKDTSDGFMADAANRYWSRTSKEGGLENGKYVMLEMTGESSIKGQADLRKAYEELCPEYKYGIVGSDGKVTPINPSISTLALKDEISSNWEEFYGTGGNIKYDNDTNFSDGSGSVAVGYKNDILQAVGLTIKPTIDLTWSPVDIRTYYYSIKQKEQKREKSFTLSYMGTTIMTLNLEFTDVKYVKDGGPINKSMEDSAKQFGFSINGGLGLQDGAVSASFEFDMFKPELFMDLLQSVVVNYAFTELTRNIIEAIPAVPGQISINAIPINLVKLLSGLILSCVESVLNESIEKLVPKQRDDNGEYTDKPMVKAFTYATSKDSNASGGSWVYVNNKSDDMSVQIEQYYADGNFSDLWSQLVDNWNNFTEQLNQATKDTWDTYNEKSEELQQAAEKIQEQQGWMTYKSIVDQYNERALGYLSQIGKLLNLYDLAMASAGISDGNFEEDAKKNLVNEKLANLQYSGSIVDLENAVKENFVEFYNYYNNTVGSKANQKPTSTKADTIYAQSIYKPIVELKFTNSTVESMGINEIKKAFTTSNRNILANMFIEQKSEGYNAIRQIDWNTYGLKFWDKFGKTVADIYFTEEADAEANPVNANIPSLKNSENDLVYFTADGKTPDGWQNYDGLNYYFVGDGPFVNYEGKSNGGTAANIYVYPGYWGERGLTVMGDRYYIAYDGSREDKYDKKSAWEGVSTYIFESSSVVNTASTNSALSAQTRSVLEASKLKTKNQISALTEVSEEKSELAKEFAKNIITFRPLGDPTTENDIKVLGKWIESQNKASVNAPHKSYRVQEMEPEQIDAYMASGVGQRNYLMLTHEGLDRVDIGGNYRSYIGMFSYTDTDTVMALYELAEINYAVGLIAIISAAGVYLNFAFGLIQRAVNMAVLYIMSPISISFFPFDDGAKFKQQFVTPFYKEAISAFAVIISLNIFTILLDPVSETVKQVTGNAMIGWLALVAMVSMLPKVRETIQGVLGAGGLAQKSLGQMFNDAGKALGFDSAKKLARKTAGGIAALQKAKAARDVKKQAKNLEEKNKLEKKLKEGGKLNAFERHRLKKLQGKEERDKKMEDALKNGSNENLSFTEKRRFDRLQNAAAKEAGNLKRNNGESDEAYAKRVEAKKQELFANADFRKKNGGNAVVKHASKIWNSEGGKAVRSAVAKTVGGLGKAHKLVTAPGRFIANSLWGEGTLLGELINDKKEALKENKNSLAGAFLNLKDPRVNNKLRKQVLDKEIAKQKELADPLTDLTAGIEMLARKDIEKDKQVNELARKKLVKEKVGNSKTEEKLIDLLTAEEIERAEANGEKISFHDAREKAKQIAEENIGATSLEEAYNLAGGDAKYVNGVVNGVKGFENFTTVPPINWEDDSIKNQLNKIESDLQKRLANGTVSLKAELEQISTKQDTTVKDFKEVMHSELHFDNEADKKAFDKVIDNCRNDPTMTFDKLLDKCVDILGSGKKASLEDALTKHQVMSVVHNDEISELKALLAASQAADKGKEMFLGKIGDFVSDADKEKIADAFRAARDTSAASTNPNSIGYRIEHEVNQNSNLSDDEKAKRREEITYEVKANAEAVLKDFRAKYENDMREYSAAKKYKEASSAVEAVAMVSELQNQRDYHMNVNMQVPDIQMIVNDGLIQKLHESGDYAGAGYKLQELVTAIKQHDDAKAIQLGFDEATIEKMKQLESSGQIARLKSIQELGEFDAAYMGNISDSMGGSGLAGMEAAFAQLTRVAESKTISEKFKIAADDFAHREAQNRAIVEQTLKKIESTMTGSAWEELAKNMGVDISKLSSTLTDAMSGVNKGTHSMADVKSVIDALTAYRNDSLDKPAIVETLDMVLGGFSSANLANEQCDQTNALRSKLSDLEGSLQDIMKKLKPLLGGK